jgi:hypothetical protein
LEIRVQKKPTNRDHLGAKSRSAVLADDPTAGGSTALDRLADATLRLGQAIEGLAAAFHSPQSTTGPEGEVTATQPPSLADGSSEGDKRPAGRPKAAERAAAASLWETDPNARLTPAEVGARLGVAVRTLANWRGKNGRPGQGPVFYKIGGRIFYVRKDVDAYLLAQRHDG